MHIFNFIKNSRLNSNEVVSFCIPNGKMQLFPTSSAFNIDISLLYLFIYFSSLIQRISTTASLLPLPPSVSLLPWPQIYCSSFTVEKLADLPVISIERVTIRINKTRHIPLYQGWMRQPNRMKMVPRAGVRDTPTSTTKSLRKTQDKQFMQRT